MLDAASCRQRAGSRQGQGLVERAGEFVFGHFARCFREFTMLNGAKLGCMAANFQVVRRIAKKLVRLAAGHKPGKRPFPGFSRRSCE